MTLVRPPQSPEERELDRKKAHLASLEIQLVQAELELSTLTSELQAFEIKYLRIVSPRYAELDWLELEITNILVALYPHRSDLFQKAEQAKSRAQESHETAEHMRGLNSNTSFKTSPDVKKAFREAAKKLHPDLALDEKEKARRTVAMAELNAAYQDGDEAWIQAILDNWVNAPESIEGNDIASRLIRVIRTIYQVEQRLTQIKTKIARLKDSEFHHLREMVEGECERGGDLLAEMAKKLDDQIAKKKLLLASLRARMDGLGVQNARH